jgi:predicted transcriptional regulator
MLQFLGMKKKQPAPPALQVTSLRLDPDLTDRAHALARKNKRAVPRIAEDALYKVVNAALAEYLKKRSA